VVQQGLVQQGVVQRRVVQQALPLLLLLQSRQQETQR
jgi:hypothetical protein